MSNSTHNLQINSVAYQDSTTSNNPSLRSWDYTIRLLGQQVQKPNSTSTLLAPNQSFTAFDGTRSLLLDGTTTFNVTQPDPTQLIYRFTAVSGTLPGFRTDRLLLLDTTSQITLTVNGPIVTLTSSGGTSMTTTNVVVGDLIRLDVGCGCSVGNQGIFSIVGKSSNSLSIQNINGGVAETFTVLDVTKIIAYSNGSSNQVLIGDTAQISGAFSIATQGSYQVQDVAPTWIQLSIGNQGGIPSETGIALGSASNLIIYSSAKNFVMIQAQQNTIVQCNGSTDNTQLVTPLEAGSPENVGVYIKMGMVYKLVLQNVSIYPALVTVSLAE